MLKTLDKIGTVNENDKRADRQNENLFSDIATKQQQPFL
jgi:hypothetical protein